VAFSNYGYPRARRSNKSFIKDLITYYEIQNCSGKILHDFPHPQKPHIQHAHNQLTRL